MQPADGGHRHCELAPLEPERDGPVKADRERGTGDAADDGADRSIGGRTIALNEAPHLVIGVLPPDFTLPSGDALGPLVGPLLGLSFWLLWIPPDPADAWLNIAWFFVTIELFFLARTIVEAPYEALQAEITRRYKSGEASPDALLQ